MGVNILYKKVLSLAKGHDQIKAEAWRDWSMMTRFLVVHADWLRLLAVMGSEEFDWFSTGYYNPFSEIGCFNLDSCFNLGHRWHTWRLTC